MQANLNRTTAPANWQEVRLLVNSQDIRIGKVGEARDANGNERFVAVCFADGDTAVFWTRAAASYWVSLHYQVTPTRKAA